MSFSHRTTIGVSFPSLLLKGSLPLRQEVGSLDQLVEVKLAVFQLHVEKAPDPDGFTTGFFQENWSLGGGGTLLKLSYASSAQVD